MSAQHPQPDILEQFVLGRLAASEMREVARHLLSGCTRCQEVTETLWEPAGAFEGPEDRASGVMGLAFLRTVVSADGWRSSHR